jgi:hypothetical protein
MPERTSNARVKGALLVGSVPLQDNEAVFRCAARILGERLPMIPDGETGARSHWIRFQHDYLTKDPALEPLPINEKMYSPKPIVRIKSGRRPEDVALATLGYADAAISSWDVFNRLRLGGIVPKNTKFQVCVPTPMAVVCQFIHDSDQSAMLNRYEASLIHELNRVVDAVPHDSLAVQVDVAIEFGVLEGIFKPTFEHSLSTITGALCRIGDAVPGDVSFGYHFCYGDFGHKHFVEPKDADLMVRVANETGKCLSRQVSFVHFPVPINRHDRGYFLPFGELRVGSDAEIYLGLVHLGDGVEGATRRIGTAAEFLAEFGVSTECGFGRRPPATVTDLLNLHADILERFA